MTREITHAAIIPLIGGNTLAATELMGRPPEYILSYDGFRPNEQIMLDYFRKKGHEVPYHVLESEEVRQMPRVDIVTTLCPCAGLARQNSSTNPEKRGPNAVQNQWMYRSTRQVLGGIRPRVLFGENAPALYTSRGEPVVDNLRRIGEEHGYSFSLVYTNSTQHGIPQNRPRTFYFFWDSATAPALDYVYRKAPPLAEYLDRIVPWAEHQEVIKLTDNFHTRFMVEIDRLDMIQDGTLLMELILDTPELSQKYEVYLEKEGNERETREFHRIREKKRNGMGFWDSFPRLFINKPTNAVVKKNLWTFIHPNKERFLTAREYMYLMALPDDMDMPDPKDLIPATQNVPVTTAKDFVSQIIKYVDGGLSDSGRRFLKQNNLKQRVDSVPDKRVTELF